MKNLRIILRLISLQPLRGATGGHDDSAGRGAGATARSPSEPGFKLFKHSYDDFMRNVLATKRSPMFSPTPSSEREAQSCSLLPPRPMGRMNEDIAAAPPSWTRSAPVDKATAQPEPLPFPVSPKDARAENLNKSRTEPERRPFTEQLGARTAGRANVVRSPNSGAAQPFTEQLGATSETRAISVGRSERTVRVPIIRPTSLYHQRARSVGAGSFRARMTLNRDEDVYRPKPSLVALALEAEDGKASAAGTGAAREVGRDLEFWTLQSFV